MKAKSKRKVIKLLENTKSESKAIDNNYKHSDEDLKKVIDHWNKCDGLLKCRGTERQFKEMKRWLNGFEINEFIELIDRYAEIYADKEYFFNYKWDLLTFIKHKDTYDRFCCEGSLWTAYLNRDKKQVKQTEDIEPAFEFVEGYNDVVKLLKSMDYAKYLFTEHWKHFSKQARLFYHNKCQLCDASHVPLHVHHKTYANRGRETFADVIVLCDKCHKHTHSIPKE